MSGANPTIARSSDAATVATRSNARPQSPSASALTPPSVNPPNVGRVLSSVSKTIGPTTETIGPTTDETLYALAGDGGEADADRSITGRPSFDDLRRAARAVAAASGLPAGDTPTPWTVQQHAVNAGVEQPSQTQIDGAGDALGRVYLSALRAYGDLSRKLGVVSLVDDSPRARSVEQRKMDAHNALIGETIGEAAFNAGLEGDEAAAYIMDRVIEKISAGFISQTGENVPVDRPYWPYNYGFADLSAANADWKDDVKATAVAGWPFPLGNGAVRPTAREELVSLGEQAKRFVFAIPEFVNGAREHGNIAAGIEKLQRDDDKYIFNALIEAKGQWNPTQGIKGVYGGGFEIEQEGEGSQATYKLTVDKRTALLLFAIVKIEFFGAKENPIVVSGTGEAGLGSVDSVSIELPDKASAIRAAQIARRMLLWEAVTDSASSDEFGPLNPINIANIATNPLLNNGGLIMGVSPEEYKLLIENVVEFETKLSGDILVSSEAKTEKFFNKLTSALEQRLKGKISLTQTYQPPQDNEPGKVSLTLAVEPSTENKSKLTLPPLLFGSDSFIHARGRGQNAKIEVSFDYEIEAGSEPITFLGRPYPVGNILQEVRLASPDNVSVELSISSPNQPYTDLTRTDTLETIIAFDLDDAGKVLPAINSLMQGDLEGAANFSTDGLKRKTVSVTRDGAHYQFGSSGRLAPSAQKFGFGPIIDAGNDYPELVRDETILASTPPQAPPASQTAQPEETAVPTRPSSFQPTPGFDYTVRKDDALWLIAQKYGVTTKAIIAANSDRYPQLVNNPGLIKEDWILRIPSDDLVSSTAEGRVSLRRDVEGHPSIKVERGDTLTSITEAVNRTLPEGAARYTVEFIRNFNDILDADTIRVGDVIFYPKPERRSASR